MQAIVASIYALGCPWLPHSPRWLRHVGRHDEALRAWTRLGVSPAEAEKEDIFTANAEKQESTLRGNWRQEIKQLWNKDVRKRTFLGCFLMGMMNVSIFYFSL